MTETATRWWCRIGIHPWKRVTRDRNGTTVYRCRSCGVMGL